jgi:hypothetical protein
MNYSCFEVLGYLQDISPFTPKTVFREIANAELRYTDGRPTVDRSPYMSGAHVYVANIPSAIRKLSEVPALVTC